MKYVRSYSNYAGETESHRDEAPFCGKKLV